jgi:hypothetical protein
MKILKSSIRNVYNSIIIYDSSNNQIYYENSNGYWIKREFDSNNNQIFFENSDGYWLKTEYDSKYNQILRGVIY